jgi:hypothetical protein
VSSRKSRRPRSGDLPIDANGSQSTRYELADEREEFADQRQERADQRKIDWEILQSRDESDRRPNEP